MEAKSKQKSYVVTLLLALFFGYLGIHRFYTGRIISGIFQLLTLGGFGIWTLVDIIMIALGKYTAADGQELDSYNKGCGLIVLIFLVLSFIISGLTSVVSMFAGKIF